MITSKNKINVSGKKVETAGAFSACITHTATAGKLFSPLKEACRKN